MKVLLIEDDLEFAATLIDAIDGEVVHVASRSAATETLSVDSFYDCVICDLKIPADDASGPSDVAHGIAALGEVRTRAAGTPVIVFSAFANPETLAEIMTDEPNADPFGLGSEQGLVRYFNKGDSLRCLEVVASWGRDVEELDAIEVSRGVHRVELTPAEERVLRVGARQVGGAAVAVEELHGGLSGSRTLRFRVEAPNGAVLQDSLVKVDRLEHLRDEIGRGSNLFTLMPAGTAAQPARFVNAGAADIGLIAYPVAAAADPLFQVLERDEPVALGVVTALEEATEGMRRGATPMPIRVGDLRRQMFPRSDPALVSSAVLRGRINQIEEMIVRVRTCRQHGDLHGANVLVKPDGLPIVIDFARAGIHAASLDPVTLEFGLLFHPEGRRISHGWPSLETARRWHHLDDFQVGCSFPNFVFKCRTWAHSDGVAAGDFEVYATVYALAIDQLRHTESHDIALAVLEGVGDVLA